MIVVLDACVLYPFELRNLFMWLATELVYHPRWTEEIHDEWIRSVLEDYPDIPRQRLQKTRKLMDRIDPYTLVQNYQRHIPKLVLSDINDRHVLAAAIEAEATAIITFNLSDFPVKILRRYKIRPLHPDHFLCELLTELPEKFLIAIEKHRSSLKDPPKTVTEYLTSLERFGLEKLVARLKKVHHIS